MDLNVRKLFIHLRLIGVTFLNKVVLHYVFANANVGNRRK